MTFVNQNLDNHNNNNKKEKEMEIYTDLEPSIMGLSYAHRLTGNCKYGGQFKDGARVSGWKFTRSNKKIIFFGMTEF